MQVHLKMPNDSLKLKPHNVLNSLRAISTYDIPALRPRTIAFQH